MVIWEHTDRGSAYFCPARVWQAFLGRLPGGGVPRAGSGKLRDKELEEGH